MRPRARASYRAPDGLTHAGVVVPGLALIGRRDEAASFARNAETLIDKGVIPLTWTAITYSVAGIATGCAGEWDASEAHFRKALERARDVRSGL